MDPEKLFLYIIHQLVLESTPKDLLYKDVQHFYDGSVINQLFRVLIKTRRACKKGHAKWFMETTVGLKLKTVRKMDKPLTVEELVREYF